MLSVQLPFELPVQIPIQLLLELEGNLLDQNVKELEFNPWFVYFLPTFEGQKRFFKKVFLGNSACMYG